jgi:hypothetical protein
MTALTFSVLDIVAEPYTVGPQLTARLRIEESSDTVIHAIALRCQVRIEPQRRSYSDETLSVDAVQRHGARVPGSGGAGCGAAVHL